MVRNGGEPAEGGGGCGITEMATSELNFEYVNHYSETAAGGEFATDDPAEAYCMLCDGRPDGSSASKAVLKKPAPPPCPGKPRAKRPRPISPDRAVSSSSSSSAAAAKRHRGGARSGQGGRSLPGGQRRRGAADGEDAGNNRSAAPEVTTARRTTEAEDDGGREEWRRQRRRHHHRPDNLVDELNCAGDFESSPPPLMRRGGRRHRHRADSATSFSSEDATINYVDYGSGSSRCPTPPSSGYSGATSDCRHDRVALVHCMAGPAISNLVMKTKK